MLGNVVPAVLVEVLLPNGGTWGSCATSGSPIELLSVVVVVVVAGIVRGVCAE
jgi:hypothetical protein